MLVAIAVVLSGFALLYFAVYSEERHIEKAVRRNKRLFRGSCSAAFPSASPPKLVARLKSAGMRFVGR